MPASRSSCHGMLVAGMRASHAMPTAVLGTLESQAYVTSGYLAMLSATLILAGALADRYGRRRVFIIGLVAFGATSALCGLAPTMELLVVFRLLQGVAGALLVPGPLSIITATFEGASRARAIGLWSAATAALTILGPLAGGLVVDSLSWRFAFLVNVPLVLIALYATLFHVEESRDTSSDGHFDWLGSLVATLAVGGLAFGVIRGEQEAWGDPLAWASLAIGAIALVAFPILMATRPHPLVPLSLFRNRTFAAINLATFFIYGALYITQSYQGLLMQGVLGYTATAAGAIGLPGGIMLALLSTRIGTLAGQIGARGFLVAGPLIMGLGLLWFVRLPADSPPWDASFTHPASLIPPAGVLIDVLPATLLFGLGIALIVAPLTSTLMNSVPTSRAGLGSAINNSISRVGAPLIGALIFIAISATFYSVLGSLTGLDTTAQDVRQGFPPLNPPTIEATEAQLAAAKQASVDAFHQAMLVSALLLGVGGAVSFFGLRGSKAAGGES